MVIVIFMCGDEELYRDSMSCFPDTGDKWTFNFATYKVMAREWDTRPLAPPMEHKVCTYCVLRLMQIKGKPNE